MSAGQDGSAAKAANDGEVWGCWWAPVWLCSWLDGVGQRAIVAHDDGCLRQGVAAAAAERQEQGSAAYPDPQAPRHSLLLY